MHLKRKKRLYILADSENLSNCYYIENGTVKKQPFTSFNNTTNSPFLLHNPIGWKDEEIDFATSEKYKSLNRSFSLSLSFVYEGAQIIRDRQYFGRGSEEIMYMAILKWNRDDDKYYLEYKGKLDLSTTEDDVNGGVKVNSIEGGVQAYLAANDSVEYEIRCDETNPDIRLVYLDGMNLSETLNYSFLEVDVDGGNLTIVPLTFINNEGDHVGVLYGSPTYEIVAGDPEDFFTASSNYVLKNDGTAGTIEFHLEGILPIKEIDTDDNPGTYHLTYIIANDTDLFLPAVDFVTIDIPCGVKNVPFSFDITLEAGQKLFIYQLNTFPAPGVTGGLVKYDTGDLKISFTSRKAASYAYCLLLYHYYKQLVLKLTEGKYAGESSYLAGRTDLVVTCGDALRNTDRSVVANYEISSNLENFFQSCPGDKTIGSGVGLRAINNVLYLELLSDFYSDAVPIYDLGEISGLIIKVAQIQVNTIQAGYPDQNYDTNGGKFEFNSEQERLMPILSKKGVFDVRSRWRADARGIEEIRSNLTHLDTTDNAGDKEPFLIQVSSQTLNENYTAQANETEYSGQQWLVFNGALSGNYMTTDTNRYIFTYSEGITQRANIDFYIQVDNLSETMQIILFKNGQSIGIYTGSDTDGVSLIHISIANDTLVLNDNYEVRMTPFGSNEDYTVIGASLLFDFLVEPFLLSRLPYDSITGVVDDSVFNVELRPLNQIKWHGNEIHEILAQQDGYEITLTSAKKNKDLVTVLNGTTDDEKSPIPISSLARPLGLPYDFEFTTEVPYTFQDLLTMSTAGYFAFTHMGVQLFALPRGSLKSTPARNAAQQWILRAATRNPWVNFFKASSEDIINFTFNNNMIATSIYTPLHLVKYNFSPQSKYHHVDMFEDWSYKRFQDWAHVPFYTQKWQTNDTVKIPLISSGLGQLSYAVYDEDGKLYATSLFNVISTTFVRSPYTLQEADIPLSGYAEGRYLFVIKSGDTNIWISEWCHIKEDWPDTFIYTYSHSKNELNLPWLAYNGYLEFRCESIFEQWEPDSESTYYQDDYADFKVLDDTPLQKRNLIIGTTRKTPEWVGLKVSAILRKDKVYIEGTTSDSTKHYSLREGAQMEPTKYNGMPYMSWAIEVVPAENQMFLLDEDLPVNETSGWHATIEAQVFGADYGDEEITILNE